MQIKFTAPTGQTVYLRKVVRDCKANEEAVANAKPVIYDYAIYINGTKVALWSKKGYSRGYSLYVQSTRSAAERKDNEPPNYASTSVKKPNVRGDGSYSVEVDSQSEFQKVIEEGLAEGWFPKAGDGDRLLDKQIAKWHQLQKERIEDHKKHIIKERGIELFERSKKTLLAPGAVSARELRKVVDQIEAEIAKIPQFTHVHGYWNVD